MTDDELDATVAVCSACLRASCWRGTFLCDMARSAGVVRKTRAELLVLGREHPDYFTQPKERA